VESVPIASGKGNVTGPVVLARSIFGPPVPVRTDLTLRVGGGGAMVVDSEGATWTDGFPYQPEPVCLIGGGGIGGRVRPDGSFTFIEHRPDAGRTRTLEGRFTSATTVSGTYAVPGCGASTSFSGGLVEADAGNSLGSGEVELSANSVAPGDSYSAGEGVDPFEPDTGGRGGCDRSPRAYALLVRTPASSWCAGSSPAAGPSPPTSAASKPRERCGASSSTRPGPLPRSAPSLTAPAGRAVAGPNRWI